MPLPQAAHRLGPGSLVTKIRTGQPVDGHRGSHTLMLQTLDPLGEEAEVAARGFQNIKALMQQRLPSLLFWRDHAEGG